MCLEYIGYIMLIASAVSALLAFTLQDTAMVRAVADARQQAKRENEVSRDCLRASLEAKHRQEKLKLQAEYVMLEDKLKERTASLHRAVDASCRWRSKAYNLDEKLQELRQAVLSIAPLPGGVPERKAKSE